MWDLPWAIHHVTLTYSQRRIVCRHCGIRTEGIEFADAKARHTARAAADRRAVPVDADEPRGGAARRQLGESVALEKPSSRGGIARVKRQPRHIGLDEIPGGSKRVELQTLFAANRRLFKAYVLREQLDRLSTYKTRPGVLNFLMGWLKAHCGGNGCQRWSNSATSC